MIISTILIQSQKATKEGAKRFDDDQLLKANIVTLTSEYSGEDICIKVWDEERDYVRKL